MGNRLFIVYLFQRRKSLPRRPPVGLEANPQANLNAVGTVMINFHRILRNPSALNAFYKLAGRETAQTMKECRALQAEMLATLILQSHGSKQGSSFCR